MDRGDDGKPIKAIPSLSRDARLKAALKANMARRKAQTRARAEGLHDTPSTEASATGKSGTDRTEPDGQDLSE